MYHLAIDIGASGGRHTLAILKTGVDHLLLDEEQKEILPAVSYRDSRTVKGAEEVAKVLPQAALYARTTFNITEVSA